VNQEFIVATEEDLQQVLGDIQMQFIEKPQMCAHKITVEELPRPRSKEISTRFHAHVSYLQKRLYERGIEVSREQVKFKALDIATKIGQVDGGMPYPTMPAKVTLDTPIELADGEFIYQTIIHVPDMSTSSRNNRQMMTACEGVQLLAAEYAVTLPEKYDKWGRPQG
jgi:hypothetical protein